MNKEEILRMSQLENEGRPDERELLANDKASRVGMIVGGILCLCLAMISRKILHSPELAMGAWMLYFSMVGTHKLVLSHALKDRSRLAAGIFELVLAAAHAAGLAVRVMAP